MVKISGGKSSERSINISKGILFGFFTLYLIVYGVGLEVFVQGFAASNPGVLPPFLSYLPLACYVGAAVLGLYFIIFIRNLTIHKTRQLKSTRSQKKIKLGAVYKQALFLIIFAFAFIPLLSPVIDQGKNDQNGSVYNDQWNGASTFKDLIAQEGYEVGSVQTSLSATQRLNRSVLLILMGPNTFYNPVYEVPYFMDYFEGDNALLICHDHGSTSTLLWEIFLANMFDPRLSEKVPVTVFPDGILRDNKSYATNPEFPVIETFTSSVPALTSGIRKVVLSKASCAVGGPFVEYFGWNVIGYSSLYSFIDKNGDDIYRFQDDNVDISFMLDAIGSSFPSDYLKIPLGGYPQAVFMAKETTTARVFVSADASLFNNELIAETGYDNAAFAINVVKWLTHGDTSYFVAFDEAHIRPEASRDLSSAGIFGFIIQYVVHLSTNPITAWIYPVLAIFTLRKYIPKKDPEAEKKKAAEEEKKEEKARFRTSSFFAKKIEWYHDRNKYEKALVLLYRRLERKLNALLGGRAITTERVIEMIQLKETRLTKQKAKRIELSMDKFISIKEGKGKVRNPQEFEEFVFEMEWIMANI